MLALQCDENLLFWYLLPLRVCFGHVTQKYSTFSIKEKSYMRRDDCNVGQRD